MRLLPLLALLALTMISFVGFTQDAASSGYSTLGRSAAFSLVTNINNKSNDVINQSNDYIDAADGGLLLAMVSSNGFGTKNNTNYDGLSYLLEMRQPLDSRLFITFTGGSEEQLKRKIDSIKIYGVVDTRFGSHNFTAPKIMPIIMRLEYTDLDIVERSVIGPGAREIVVENLGRNQNNVTKVRISVIR
ncbi:MAG: hypothetical protein HYW26_00480 [Candidatus Aenigmarchaeota archaeon]|nr:hypothetical protein [Candidatus Aenigmarchaeota archaeon]